MLKVEAFMSQGRPGIFSKWDLLALAGNALLLGYYLVVSPGLPEIVPAHYNAMGMVDGWAPKSQLPLMLFGLPLFTWVLLLGLGWMLSKGQADPAKARTMAVQPLRGFVGMGVCGVSAGALLAIGFGVKAIHGGMGFFILCVVIGFLITTQQTRQVLSNKPDAPLYRWGMFYVNAEDPRLWVPKRLGSGKTLNYGRPAAWFLTLVFFLVVVCTVHFLRTR